MTSQIEPLGGGGPPPFPQRQEEDNPIMSNNNNENETVTNSIPTFIEPPLLEQPVPQQHHTTTGFVGPNHQSQEYNMPVDSGIVLGHDSHPLLEESDARGNIVAQTTTTTTTTTASHHHPTAIGLSQPHLQDSNVGDNSSEIDYERESNNSNEDDDGSFCCSTRKSRERCRFVMAIIITLIFMGGLTPMGIIGTLQVFGHLDTATFSTEPGTMLGISDYIKSHTISLMWENIIYVQLQSKPPGKSLLKGSLGSTTKKLIEDVESVLNFRYGLHYPYGGFKSYYSYDYISKNLVGGDNDDTTLMMVNLRTQDASGITEEVNRVVKRYAQQDLYTITVTGMPQLLTAMKNSVLDNMVKIDMICIPIGFILFAVCVGTTPATLLIPLITLPVSLVLGLGAVAPLRHVLSITVFAPEIMLSVVIALAMDFALFLLCRIKEQLREDRQHLEKEGVIAPDEEITLQRLIELTRPKGDTVKKCMKQVTHNIVISGTAVTCAFGAIGFVYHDFVRGCAFVSAIGSATTTIVSLTLLPSATFLMFGILFSSCFGCCKQVSKEGNKEEQENGNVPSSTLTTPLLSGLAHRPGNGTSRSDQEQINSSSTTKTGSCFARIKKYFLKPPKNAEANMWGMMATFSANHPYVILVGVAALMISLIISLALGWSTDISSFSTVPHDAPEWNTFHEVRKTFGTASMSPYYILVAGQGTPLLEPESNKPNIALDENMISEKNWDILSSLTSQAKRQLGLYNSEIISPTIFNGASVSWDDISYYLGEWGCNGYPECYEYRKMLSAVCSAGYSGAVAITIRPYGSRGNSWGGEGTKFMKELEALVEDFRQHSPRTHGSSADVFIGFYGPNLSAWAVMQQVMKTFKLQVVATLGTLVLVIFLLFRSFMIALRMVLTMGMTIIFTFGSITFLMRWDYFAAAWHPLEYVHGYYWIVPILGFSIVCVVSLDYDVFLVTRIIEIRSRSVQTGHQNELNAFFEVHRDGEYSHDMACVISAVARTGPVISWAAAVMTIAFGVLCLSNTMMMAQYGLTIALAVIFDAFLVRPLIVPATMALIPPKVLWFPRRFKTVEELQGLDEENPVTEDGGAVPSEARFTTAADTEATATTAAADDAEVVPSSTVSSRRNPYSMSARSSVISTGRMPPQGNLPSTAPPLLDPDLPAPSASAAYSSSEVFNPTIVPQRVPVPETPLSQPTSSTTTRRTTYSHTSRPASTASFTNQQAAEVTPSSSVHPSPVARVEEGTDDSGQQHQSYVPPPASSPAPESLTQPEISGVMSSVPQQVPTEQHSTSAHRPRFCHVCGAPHPEGVSNLRFCYSCGEPVIVV